MGNTSVLAAEFARGAKEAGHTAGGNGEVGDITGKPELEQAYELGKSIQ